VSSAPSDLPKHVLQLAQLKHKVQADLAVVPNFTCLETIERSRRKTARQPFQHVDTVHVEVALAKDRELYSWPGANQFEDRDVTDIVGSGAISSGSFATEIKNVLVNNVSNITWRGEEEKFGRRTLRWDYNIPYNLSHWNLRSGGRTGQVSAAGSLWVDAGSLELLRLETNADAIPPDLPVAAVKSTLDYARVRIGSQDVMLPQSAELLLIDMSGEESRNRMEFSHCHEFTAQATLTFEAAPTSGTAAAPVAELSLPAGLRLPVQLAQAVDSERAAVGDALTAIVESSVEHKSKTVVPKGAVLRGRLRLLERHSSPTQYYVVGLEFTDLEFPGYHARFVGLVDAVEPIANLQWSMGASRRTIRDLPGVGTMTTSQTEAYSIRQIPGVGSFFVEATKFRLPEGLRMTWRTVDLASESR
jgi:hypothetical protein